MNFCPFNIGPRPAHNIRKVKLEMISDDLLKKVDVMVSIYRERLLFLEETIIAYRIFR